MNQIEKKCSICACKIMVPVGADFILATVLAEARKIGAAAYCPKCDCDFCFDHIVWTPVSIGESVSNAPVCPRCEGLLVGRPA